MAAPAGTVDAIHYPASEATACAYAGEELRPLPNEGDANRMTGGVFLSGFGPRHEDVPVYAPQPSAGELLRTNEARAYFANRLGKTIYVSLSSGETGVLYELANTPWATRVVIHVRDAKTPPIGVLARWIMTEYVAHLSARDALGGVRGSVDLVVHGVSDPNGFLAVVGYGIQWPGLECVSRLRLARPGEATSDAAEFHYLQSPQLITLRPETYRWFFPDSNGRGFAASQSTCNVRAIYMVLTAELAATVPEEALVAFMRHFAPFARHYYVRASGPGGFDAACMLFARAPFVVGAEMDTTVDDMDSDDAAAIALDGLKRLFKPRN